VPTALKIIGYKKRIFAEKTLFLTARLTVILNELVI
jgi:hypothetical protein